MNHEEVRTVLKRKRTVEILKYLSESGVKNYTDIENTFEGSSDTISDTLKVLNEYNLVDRTEKTKKDVRYEITEQGIELLELVEKIGVLLTEAKD